MSLPIVAPHDSYEQWREKTNIVSMSVGDMEDLTFPYGSLVQAVNHIKFQLESGISPEEIVIPTGLLKGQDGIFSVAIPGVDYALPGEISGNPELIPTDIISSTYTALVGFLTRLDSSGGGFTVYLPSNPNDGDMVGFMDVTRSLGSNPVIVNPGSKTIDGNGASLSLNTENQYIELFYNSVSTDWKIKDSPLVNPDGSSNFVTYEDNPSNVLMDGVASAGTLGTVSRGNHIHPTDTSRAPLVSPTFSGTPAAPTATTGTNTTQIATTAFIQTELNNLFAISMVL